MSGDDAFDRAVKALRETGETSPADVARTRMRVMETLHRGERRGRRTMWVLLPIAAVLAGSTALAKNPELARRVWTGVAETVGIAGPSERGPGVRSWKRSTVPADNGAPAENDQAAQNGLATAPDENGASNPNAAEDAPRADKAALEDAARVDKASSGERAAREGSPAARRPRRSDGADNAVAPAPSNTPPQTVEPETAQGTAVNGAEAASLQLYKQAYRLHFVEQRYAAALAAWDDYLRASPSGRLVVEARYNRAIALVRLGRRAEAETALAPFARGEVGGGYRAREARELLDALNGSSH